MNLKETGERLNDEALRLARSLPELDRVQLVLGKDGWRCDATPEGSAHDRLEALAAIDAVLGILRGCVTDPRLHLAMDIPLRAARRFGDATFEITGLFNVTWNFAARATVFPKRLALLAGLMDLAPRSGGSHPTRIDDHLWTGLCRYSSQQSEEIFRPLGTVHRVCAHDVATAVRWMRLEALAVEILRQGSIPDSAGIAPSEVRMLVGEQEIPELLDDIEADLVALRARVESDDTPA